MIGVLFLGFLFPKARSQREEVFYTLYTVTERETALAFQVGDILHDGVSKASLGRLTGVEISPAYTESKSGVRESDKVTLRLFLSAEADKKGDSYFLGSIPLKAGQAFAVHGKGACEAFFLAFSSAP
ncbi:MAG: hypothetical protein J6K61_05115 [Clostridia bacterium]|nr:hypothetical protein [Clostridia bacterium]